MKSQLNTDGHKLTKNNAGRRRGTVILLIGALVGFGAGYLWQAYRSETGIFSANRYRDWQAEGKSQRYWAQKSYLEEVPNFHKVSEDLYRSAQPSAEGMQGLARLGIKTIINLRDSHSDRDEIGDLPLGYERIEMEADDPEDEQIIRFLQIVSNTERGPFLVHCKHGADRTGVMCAVYRIAIEGWSKQDAIEEMTKGGFGFHRWWNDLETYIQELNIGGIKKRAGLQEKESVLQTTQSSAKPTKAD